MCRLLAFILLGFTSTAFAADAASPPMWNNLILFGALFAVLYFTLIRPQQRRAKDHQNLLSKVAIDDEIVTAGGIVGRVTRIKDQFLMLEIAPNTEIKIQKQAIVSALPKGTLKTL